MKYLLVCILFLISCKQRPIDPLKHQRNTPIITLSVSETHKTDLGMQIKGNEFTENDSLFVFEHLDKITSKNCQNNKPSINGKNWVVSSLMSGCLNFYMMNDIDAYKSFNIIKRVSGRDKDCYTVGFSQLYLMYSFAECKNITAIDIDWRILYTHYQLLTLIKTEKHKTVRLLSKVKLDKKTTNNELRTFCSQVDIESCRVALSDFMKKYKDIETINLRLYFLHQLTIKETTNDIVLYVSNAIDPEYTTQEQFDKIKNNIADRLDKQNGYIVYHTGGNELFAIYKLYKKNKKLRIRTVCRDDLTWARSYGNLYGKQYSTYLDLIAENRLFNQSCSEY